MLPTDYRKTRTGHEWLMKSCSTLANLDLYVRVHISKLLRRGYVQPVVMSVIQLTVVSVS